MPKPKLSTLTPAQRDARWLAYRAKYLPLQLDRARRRVIHLQREAARLGIPVEPWKDETMTDTRTEPSEGVQLCPSDGKPCTMDCWRGPPARPCDPVKPSTKVAA